MLLRKLVTLTGLVCLKLMMALLLVLLLSLQIEIGLVENRLVSLQVKVLLYKLLVFDSLLCTVLDG